MTKAGATEAFSMALRLRQQAAVARGLSPNTAKRPASEIASLVIAEHNPNCTLAPKKTDAETNLAMLEAKAAAQMGARRTAQGRLPEAFQARVNALLADLKAERVSDEELQELSAALDSGDLDTFQELARRAPTSRAFFAMKDLGEVAALRNYPALEATVTPRLAAAFEAGHADAPLTEEEGAVLRAMHRVGDECDFRDISMPHEPLTV